MEMFGSVLKIYLRLLINCIKKDLVSLNYIHGLIYMNHSV